MKSGFSAEHSTGIDESMHFIFQDVVPILEEQLLTITFEAGEIELFYVPVVMNERDVKSYPARSKLRRIARVIECCPQLDFDVFRIGSQKEVLLEYVRGLAFAETKLADLGATKEELAQFSEILKQLPSLVISRQD